MATRRTFDPEAKAAPQQAAPTHNCKAHGCPCIGSMYESPGQAQGWCPYHFGAQVHDLQRITALLREHIVVVEWIRHASLALAREPLNVEKHDRMLHLAHDLMRQAGYTVPLTPWPHRPPTNLRDARWGWENWLGAEVVGVRKLRAGAARQATAAPTMTRVSDALP
jgi:hypothetical protein